ncbi:FMN reductase (NADPH) [bacterium YEK0313]|nr:FMN reductase (NADPH) [bacterium YEK0313]
MVRRQGARLARKPVVVAISGSPSPASATAELADHVLGLLAPAVAIGGHIRLRELDPAALMSGRTDDAGLAAAMRDVEAADGLVIATPIYKAAYSGLLKAFLDAMPQFGLAGRTVLPLATGGSLAHVLALDYALRPVLQSMGARHIVQATFVAAGQMRRDGATFGLDPAAAELLDEAVLHFAHAVAGASPQTLFGHPRPARREAAE